MKLITRQGMRLAAVGVVIGLVFALAFAKVLSSLLIGVSGYDVTTFILVPTLLAAVALVACYLPARRATKVDPLLRSDTNDLGVRRPCAALFIDVVIKAKAALAAALQGGSLWTHLLKTFDTRSEVC